jgi:hypothetical protein
LCRPAGGAEPRPYNSGTPAQAYETPGLTL